MDVLSSTEISSEVLKLIEGARQFLILVTPYFDPWDRLAAELKRAAIRPGLKMAMLLRGGDDRRKQEEKAGDLVTLGVKVHFLSRLHAKVYICETHALVTSMNLLKSSALDSWELALRVDAVKDAAVFKDIVAKMGELLQRSKDEAAVAEAHATNQVYASFLGSLSGAPTPPPARVAPLKVAPPRPAPTRAPAPTGYCIRCGDDIALNPDRPLCNSCYKAWAKFENPDYKEAHCHACGKEKATSFAKPLCRPCWEAGT